MILPSWLIPIELPMPATFGAVMVYLVKGPNGIALIDTGMNDASSRLELKKRFDGFGLKFSDVDILVCTHHHPDHAGLGRTFSEAGAQTMMSQLDAKSLELYFAELESDETRAAFGGCHETSPQFVERVAGIFPFFRSLAEEFKPTTTIGEGDQIDLGGIPFQVLLTPGHTLGHVCLQCDQWLFTGDCILPREAAHVSMRLEAIGTDPLGQFLVSLRRIGNLDKLVGIPGHGSPMENLSSRAEELISHHKKRLEQVCKTLRDEPKPAYTITRKALGARSKSFARWLAMSQVLAYLEHLVNLNKAQEVIIRGKKRYRLST
jgi:glyoxylase-like metal-dependent hydrolase (beta-lactamase superfamily II)